VDRLIAAKLDVWFAEYAILLDEYDDFQKHIDDAIDKSQFAIIVATESWAHSRYCQIEIARMIQRIALDRIVHVVLPEPGRTEDHPQTLEEWSLQHYLRNRTARSERISAREAWMEVDIEGGNDMFGVEIHQSEHPDQAPIDISKIHRVESGMDPTAIANEVVRIIAPNRTIPQRIPVRVSPNASVRYFERFGVSICTGPFDTWLDPNTRSAAINWAAGLYRTTIDGVDIGMAIDVSPHQSIVPTMLLPEELNATEEDEAQRRIAKMYRDFARTWRGSAMEDREFGLHLFRRRQSPASGGQFAITYISRDNPIIGEGHCWERRYAISSRSNDETPIGEVDIIFSVALPETDREQGLAQFCEFAPLFDSIVDTLEYRAIGRINDSTVSTLVAFLFIFAGIQRYLRIAVVDGDVPLIILLSSAAGLFTATLAQIFISKDASYSWRAFGTAHDRAEKPFPSMIRIPSDACQHVLQAGFRAFQNLRRGAFNIVGAPIVGATIVLWRESSVAWFATGLIVGAIGAYRFKDYLSRRKLRI